MLFFIRTLFCFYIERFYFPQIDEQDNFMTRGFKRSKNKKKVLIYIFEFSLINSSLIIQ